MQHTLKFTAILLAVSVLGLTAAKAEIVQQVYTAPAPGVVYSTQPTTYVTQTRRVATRVVPHTIVVPSTYAPQTVVTERYVVPQVETYVVPQTTTRVIYRPANCGTYHYWNGETCVDARDEPTFRVTYE